MLLKSYEDIKRISSDNTNLFLLNFLVIFAGAAFKLEKVGFNLAKTLYGVFPGLLGQGISVMYARRIARTS